MMNDAEITSLAIIEAKKLKMCLAKFLVDGNIQGDSPVSVFMTGSPGAG